MGIPFTKEQEEVIRHKDGSLLVSAAAGSGKTAVLVERIMTMLMDKEDPVPLDQILVLTFTNQAASQMKEKIERRILELLEEDEDNDYLKEQLHLIPLANIQTNHAFSLRIVRDYITRLEELDPGYRIADETEIKLLRIDVLGKVLEDWYLRALEAPEDPESLCFMNFTENYGGTRQDSRLEDLILDLYEYMLSDPAPIKWLERSVRAFDPDTISEDDIKEKLSVLTEDVVSSVVANLSMVVRLYEECFDDLTDKDRIKIEKILSNLQEAIDGCLHLESAEEKADFLASFVFERQLLKPCKENGDLIKKTLSAAKDKITEVVSLQRSYDPSSVKQDCELVYPAMRGLEYLIKDFDLQYRLKKKERNLLEFSDFEHGALRILEDPNIAKALSERYRYIYIDEYQDCNQVQEAIIQKIARKDASGQDINVFRVGDVKQSIYRFRQADPSLFLERYERFGRMPNTSLLMLNKNFRSQRPIIDAVNDIFEALMTREVGGLGYGDRERLYLGAREVKENSHVELTIVETEDSKDRVESEAEATARKVVSLIEIGYDYKDIVILMRSVSNYGKAYMDALLRRGIPAYASTSENFYDAKEVATVVNLLRVIDNPHQDIPLLGVLVSPLVGLGDDDLGKVRLSLPEGDFYEALQAFAASEETPKEGTAQEKVRRFLMDLAVWKEEATLYDIHDFIWKLLTSTGYLGYIKTMPSGALREANIELLLQKSIDFEKGSYSGLNAFLRYIDEMDRNQKQEDEAKLFSEGQEIVRIMTIHQSKGLEFPAVILAGLGRGFNLSDLSGTILMHDRFGLGVDVIDTDRSYKYPSLSKKVLQSVLRKEQMAEEIRLLYVAMTRAKEQLILIGSRGPQPEKKADPKDEAYTVPGQEILYAKSILALLENILMHKYTVRIEQKVEQAEGIPALTDVTVPYTSQTLFDHTYPGFSEEDKAAVLEKLNWQYPRKAERMIPQVVSVSSLKHQRMEEVRDEDTTEVPTLSFASSESGLGARRGTAFHTLMSFSDRKALISDPEKEIERLVRQGLISKEDQELIPRKWILNVTGSELFKELLEAENTGRKIYVEESFILQVPFEWISAYFPEPLQMSKTKDRVLVQGIIDLFYEKDDGFILVDYKTDAVLDEARVAGYTLQLQLYKRAIEKATQKKVNKMMLFDVRRGKEIIC